MYLKKFEAFVYIVELRFKFLKGSFTYIYIYIHLNSILELKNNNNKKIKIKTQENSKKETEKRIEKDAYALFNFAAYNFHYIVSSPLTT